MIYLDAIQQEKYLSGCWTLLVFVCDFDCNILATRGWFC